MKGIINDFLNFYNREKIFNYVKISNFVKSLTTMILRSIYKEILSTIATLKNKNSKSFKNNENLAIKFHKNSKRFKDVLGTKNFSLVKAIKAKSLKYFIFS